MTQACAPPQPATPRLLDLTRSRLLAAVRRAADAFGADGVNRAVEALGLSNATVGGRLLSLRLSQRVALEFYALAL